VLFIVQSPYSCTIGHRGVFSLGRWSGRFHTGFHEPRATLVRLSTPISPFAYRTLTFFGPTFQRVPLGYFSSRRPQPRDESRFGLFRVRPARPMRSAAGDRVLPRPRFRIQTPSDRRPFAGSPRHFAGYRVFRRLSMPRHPPYTLRSLVTFTDHRRSRQSLGRPAAPAQGRAGNGSPAHLDTPPAPVPPGGGRSRMTARWRGPADTGTINRRKGARHAPVPDGKTSN